MHLMVISAGYGICGHIPTAIFTIPVLNLQIVSAAGKRMMRLAEFPGDHVVSRNIELTKENILTDLCVAVTLTYSLQAQPGYVKARI